MAFDTDLQATPADNPSKATSPSTSTKQKPKLFRTIWRWHLYAGLMVWPVLVWASLTGAIYIFVDEVEPLMYPRLMVVDPGSTRIGLQQQATAVSAEFPQEPIAFLHVNHRADRPTVFSVKTKHQGFRHVYVNPYSGEVLGSLIHNEMFFPIVRKLHRNMFAGTFGRGLTELATSWGIALLATGLFLWWPRGKTKGGQGVWSLRWQQGGKLRLRDLHAVVAVYGLPVILAIMVTGLLYTQVWGRTFFAIGKSTEAFPKTLTDPPPSIDPGNARPISLDQVAAVAEERGLGGKRFQIILPYDFRKDQRDPTGCFRVRGDKSLVVDQRLISIDQYSGTVLAESDWNDASFMGKYVLLAYPVHVGSIFGMTTKIIALIACLIIVSTCVTGVTMWWRSRPAGGWRIPQRNEGESAPWWLLLLVAAVGIAMPMVGASVLLFMLFDWLVLRWFRPTRNKRVATSGS